MVPNDWDQNLYLVIGLVRTGLARTEIEKTDLETVINDLLHGQYNNPIGVFGFNPVEGLVEGCLRQRRPGGCAAAAIWRSGTSSVVDFVERHEGRAAVN
jgi:hypothetical protein